ELNIGLKWPNDIYVNGSVKIGGLNKFDPQSINNAGCALNVGNSSPTTCINDLREFEHYKKKLPHLSYEKTFAIIFNEIEKVLNKVQTGDFDFLYNSYYKIVDKEGTEKKAKVTGIDEYGFLMVQLENGAVETVHPDGNSFDMLKGLILPKNF
uniref:BPL/LPL catalytic domain-containing protein n=1 Tax=Megaselia scalaris TaxID=36166 RepID=T1H5Y9_MEGSC